MRPRREDPRILGPYHERGYVRFVIIGATGGRCSVKAAEEGTARLLAETTLAKRTAITEEVITVTVAIDRYQEYLRDVKQNRPKSVAETTRRMRVFFCDAEQGTRLLTYWTAARCSARYEEFAKSVSVDYHRNTLSEARTFLGWCADKTRAWLKQNPLLGIKGVGKRRHGKLQHRPAESLLWRTKAVELAKQGDDGAVAALLLLDGGARPGEVVTRQVRDLVDHGRFVLVAEVEGTDWQPKTEKSHRPLGPLPPDLAALLVEQARAKLPSAYLFPARGGTKRQAGGPHDVGWMDDQVKRICRLAGVPERCAHSMRGMRTTLDLLAGRSVEQVASDRGHEDTRTTLTSYAAPGAAQDAAQQRYLDSLKGAK